MNFIKLKNWVFEVFGSMLRRAGLSVRRTFLLSRGLKDPADIDDDPYLFHTKSPTQEELEEELGYNKTYLDFTDEC